MPMFAGILDLGLDIDVWPWVWLGVAAVLALVELTTVPGSFILLPFAISAFVASLMGFADAPVELQWLTFVVLGAVLFLVMLRWARGFTSRNPTPSGVGADRHVGLTATVTVPISRDDVDRRGRVRIDGEDWGALTESDTTLLTGTQVRVVAMRGTRVVVRLAPSDAPDDHDRKSQP